MNIIYIHGYKGENSSKFKLIEQHFPEFNAIKPNQNEHSPLETLKSISEIIENSDEKNFIIASSRGGIFGQYLSRKYDIPILLINPVFRPYNDFKKKLANDFESKQIEIIFKELNQIHNHTMEMKYRTDLTNIWLAKSDEVLNHDELIKHYDSSCIDYYDTDHRFSIFADKLDDLKSIIEKYE